MMYDPVLQNLIDDLCCLPGVGQKTAQRMAFYILQRDRAGGKKLAQSLQKSIDTIRSCQRCRNLSSAPICTICNDQKRKQDQICVVESPADLIALQQATDYQGLYFVLGGRLSPLDGIGPEQLALDQLQHRIEKEAIRELILAISPTLEGEATAHYIRSFLPHSVLLTRIAPGIPIGSELGYMDQQTIAHAFNSRIELDSK